MTSFICLSSSMFYYERDGTMKKSNKILDYIVIIGLIVLKYLVLFVIDGSIYIVMELIYRGHSHISMFILGGIVGVLVGGLNNWYTWKMSLLFQMGISTIIITCLEYLTGAIVNIGLGLNVWDYSNLPLNIHGQICLYFSFVWFFVSFIAIVLDDWLRYKLFGEEFHKYILI